MAKRVLDDFPSEAVHPHVHVPEELPAGVLAGPPAKAPQYAEAAPGALAGEDASDFGERSPADRQRDKLAEKRAVELAIEALKRDGWKPTADRQADGVGYDLEFVKGTRCLKVEVKGIQGRALAFNLTPKEWWRAETDPRWVVLAVTSVLSPKDFKVHLLTRDAVMASKRVITGYRLTVS